MFNPGDRIRVKENGLTGMIERWLKRVDTTHGYILTYDLRWEHDPNRTCSYDFKTDWEAEQIWELDGGRTAVPKAAFFNFGQMPPGNIEPIKVPGIFGQETRECQHEWADYTGLMQSYQYCKKCDVKNENN